MTLIAATPIIGWNNLCCKQYCLSCLPPLAVYNVKEHTFPYSTIFFLYQLAKKQCSSLDRRKVQLCCIFIFLQVVSESETQLSSNIFKQSCDRQHYSEARESRSRCFPVRNAFFFGRLVASAKRKPHRAGSFPRYISSHYAYAH